MRSSTARIRSTLEPSTKARTWLRVTSRTPTSIAKAEDLLLGRAGLDRLRLGRRLRALGDAAAQLARDRGIVGPALVQRGKREVDLAPLGMAALLQRVEVLAQRAREAYQ